nr:MAG TPA: hypothetical protein [Caudoviricetes sp.]DAK40090.1 MAG TPA: hypothetical protein [Caudoviricetes sp.]DAU42491.1 MAG TPA: hypothetical protein [Caudoviricetes sp.]
MLLQNKERRIFLLNDPQAQACGLFLFYKGQKRGKNVVNVCKTM